MSLIWVVGILSNLIIVPVVGAITDRSTSRWGRRRPFMIGGAVAAGIGLLLFGWAETVVGYFVREEPLKSRSTIAVAVLSMYTFDFALNTVGSSSRSLIVDTLPSSQQQAGSAWASRMAATGHLLGYFIGSLDIVSILGSGFGGSQFRSMILIAVMTLNFAIGVTCISVSERRLMPSASSQAKPALAVLTELFQHAINLPPRMQSICWIHFWSWVGFFPFMIYSSTWVGETYYRYELPASESASGSHDVLSKVGRLGSLSLVIMSTVQFTAAVVLPYMVESPKGAPGTASFTPRLPEGLSKAFEGGCLHVSKFRPNMVTTWMIGELLFASTMFCAPIVRSLAFAMTIVAAAGVPWCLASWAPFAEMGVEINNMSGLEDSTMMTANGTYQAVLAEDPVEVNDVDLEREVLHHRRHSTSLLRPEPALTEHEDTLTGEQAGIYMGVLNACSTLPQLLGTFVCWAIFSILEPGKDDVSDDDPDHKWLDLRKDAPNPIGVCFFFGGCLALVAAECMRRLRSSDKAVDACLVQ
ncbi:hypothetical protein EPUS_04667 [Endocarpon pusillum Z07020]|uniref:Major facilitator superfamily (MFS) profile domain-containing protein n=1 Tax=Endocarpon pusillum (strain Z07020 / HMAS-L-300199) TaxID=1263415 RepID=U1HI60_ENDPU|nr:uncharacterized protein EPUS_04667 [Endocarpon pusillum Z07020]ERF68569.1 hypothetical protein EPUS_04667 [Endocarpon pusillum Z07020]